MGEPSPEPPKQEAVRPPAKLDEKSSAHTPLPIEKLHKIQRERDKAAIEGIKARLKGFNLEKDQQKARKLVEKADTKLKEQGAAIDNPMARFNLNLDNQNPDIQTMPESRLKPYAQPELTDKLRKELATPEKIADPQTGQKFNVLKLNWSENPTERGRVLVVLPQYNSEIRHESVHYRIQELAHQLQVPVLAIDHPQMGDSDKLTPAQKDGLKGKEGYGLIADAQLRVMKELGITEIDVTGRSMGAWAAASLAERAASHGIKVHHAVIVDSPGVVEMNPNGLVNELSKQEAAENKYADVYRNTPYDPEMRISGKQNRSAVRRKIDIGVWVASTLVNDPGGIYKKAMSKESLQGTLQAALEVNPDLKVRIVNGSKSEVSPAEANSKIVGTLKQKFSDRVSQSVYSGEPHLVMDNAKRYATQVGLAIRT